MYFTHTLVLKYVFIVIKVIILQKSLMNILGAIC